MTKEYITRNLYLFGLGIVLIFNFCNSNKNGETEIKSVITESISNNAKNEIKLESEQSQNDTTLVQNRFYGNDKFPRLVELEYAKTTITLKDTSQFQLIDKVSVIFVIPDISLINKQQNENVRDWNKELGDNQYYEYLNNDSFQKLDIETFSIISEKRFLKFIELDNTSYIIDLTKIEGAKGVILFNRLDSPVLLDSTDIGTELKEEFIINYLNIDYKENLQLATDLFISKSEIPDNVLLNLVPENYEELRLFLSTTYPDNIMQNTFFFHIITQRIFDKVIVENNYDFYLPSLQLASFADGEFGEGFTENLEKIIDLDINKFCESVKGKEYSKRNPIKYYVEKYDCK